MINPPDDYVLGEKDVILARIIPSLQTPSLFHLRRHQMHHDVPLSEHFSVFVLMFLSVEHVMSDVF